LTIHFAALFSEKEDAVPIALFHGWPGNLKTSLVCSPVFPQSNTSFQSGSFLEFLPILSLFRDEYEPSKLPYHLIIPSLPGYTFSSGPPLDRDFGIEDIGRIMNELMTQLGFGGGYVAQGGDIGSRVARILAAEYESCKGLSLYFSLFIASNSKSGRTDARPSSRTQ
jgi:microsomal epoxide hydrolase